MALRIEDYALLSDLSSCALVGNDGSIDWLTFPRFDSPAPFAALLGEGRHNGRWKLAPSDTVRSVERTYRDSSLVLETVFTTDTGVVALIDCMPPGDDRHDLIRVVECREGSVNMEMEITFRFDYGSIIPWVRRVPGGIEAIGGPDALRLAAPVELTGEDLATTASFPLRRDEHIGFSLSWFLSHQAPPQPLDAVTAVATTEQWWRVWAQGCTYEGDYADLVRRSAVVLKGLTLQRTGGLVAAATTSLPEELGGVRNWDYRYCWLRDATFSLLALQSAGFDAEADAWRDWLLRAVAGDPGQLQIMYGPAGERRLTEQELTWLEGYEQSQPVRVGNQAHGQYQLDVYGEVLDALHQSAEDDQHIDADSWSLLRNLVDFVGDHWRDPDDGIWEVRGGRRQFTHSKVMAWVAVDRAISLMERFAAGTLHLDAATHLGPVDLGAWEDLRAEIHADVLANGVDADGAFVQSYGAPDYDAALLLVPLVGFLEPEDPRVAATVAAVERELMVDGLVRRYVNTEHDGLAGEEGTFLMCSFWLADNYALLGRLEEATELFERLVGLTNDVGLLAEQYDPLAGRMLGNFPQAFSHVSLINTAGNLYAARLQRERSPEAFTGSADRRRVHPD